MDALDRSNFRLGPDKARRSTRMARDVVSRKNGWPNRSFLEQPSGPGPEAGGSVRDFRIRGQNVARADERAVPWGGISVTFVKFAQRTNRRRGIVA